MLVELRPVDAARLLSFLCTLREDGVNRVEDSARRFAECARIVGVSTGAQTEEPVILLVVCDVQRQAPALCATQPTFLWRCTPRRRAVSPPCVPRAGCCQASSIQGRQRKNLQRGAMYEARHKRIQRRGGRVRGLSRLSVPATTPVPQLTSIAGSLSGSGTYSNMSSESQKA